MSEKAWSIRIKYDALKRKVGRPSGNGEPSSSLNDTEGRNGELSSLLGKTSEIIAEQYVTQKGQQNMNMFVLFIAVVIIAALIIMGVSVLIQQVVEKFLIHNKEK